METGVYFLVTRLFGFKKEGRSCREFVTHATLKYRQRGTACRDDGGEWRIVEAL